MIFIFIYLNASPSAALGSPAWRAASFTDAPDNKHSGARTSVIFLSPTSTVWMCRPGAGVKEQCSRPECDALIHELASEHLYFSCVEVRKGYCIRCIYRIQVCTPFKRFLKEACWECSVRSHILRVAHVHMLSHQNAFKFKCFFISVASFWMIPLGRHLIRFLFGCVCWIGWYRDLFDGPSAQYIS